jgi:hypothetical protein
MGVKVEILRMSLQNKKSSRKLTIAHQATKSIYPFHDGSLEDFEPIFQKLIAVSIPKRNTSTLQLTPIAKHQRRKYRRLH